MTNRTISSVKTLTALLSIWNSPIIAQEKPIIALDLSSHSFACTALKDAYMGDETILSTTYARLRAHHSPSIPLEMLMLKSDYENACDFYDEFTKKYLKNNPTFSPNYDLFANVSNGCKKFTIVGIGQPTVYKSPSGRSKYTYFSMVQLRPLINFTHGKENILPIFTTLLRQTSQ